MEHMRKTNHTRLPNYMTMIKHMTIRNKILMVITAVLMLCSVLITSVCTLPAARWLTHI